MSQIHQHLLAESELTLEAVDLQQKSYTGDADAQYALANIFQKGSNVAKHPRHAFYWYQRAAKQGNLLAQYKVWMGYLLGDGIEADDKEASKWLRRASLKSGNSTKSIVMQFLNTGTKVH
jgi:TPR repeat protein